MKNVLRLDKILAHMGFGTRKEVKLLVKKGKVTVDGQGVKDSSLQVNTSLSVIEVDGQQVRYREFVYIMMNKPAGVISASFDKHQETVVDLLPEEYAPFEVFPVGRLDKDTEGLLLLSNDGKLAHELLAPNRHVPKIYFAVVEGQVTQEDVEKFKAGVVLDDGYKTRPAELVILESEDTSEIELTIHEGKFHQVKRMFEAVGKEVKYLKRLSMGSLKLEPVLGLGEFRELTDEELNSLRNNEKPPV
ncbi:MAG: pseudouridine synthase [Thermincolia bacterium]